MKDYVILLSFFREPKVEPDPVYLIIPTKSLIQVKMTVNAGVGSSEFICLLA
jgi:hypothetical protein